MKKWKVWEAMKEKVEQFRQTMPLIQDLKNPALRLRHWDALRSEVSEARRKRGGPRGAAARVTSGGRVSTYLAPKQSGDWLLSFLRYVVKNTGNGCINPWSFIFGDCHSDIIVKGET